MNEELTTNTANTMLDATNTGISILDLSIKGGWVMLFLLILSIVALYIFISKLIEIRKASKEDSSFMARIQDYMADDKISSAIKLSEDTASPYAKMIKVGIQNRELPMSDMLILIDNVGNIEIGRLEKGLATMATIAAVAPMIGFLGTVMGMVQSFFDLSNAGTNAVNIQLLSGGIYQALVTTVGGLIVGILALIGYNMLVSMLDRVINKMESKTMEFIEVINKKA